VTEAASVIVISDTSPIVNLAVVGRLDLLRQLYERVVVPKAVREEIARGMRQPVLAEIASCTWIETQAVANQVVVSSLELELDRGEAEAIALAVELRAALVLMDERKGRRVALHLGIMPVGLLGILIEAKNKQLIEAVRPLMDDLIQKAGFWIGQELYNHVLRAAGE
jgi:predicted nucleic acid-binding protein